jgi:hypothetical protein
MFNLIIIYKGEWETLWWEWWNIVGAVECDSGGAVDEGVVNICGGEKVAEWMWHNIWREKGRGESELASARCRLHPYSEVLILVRFYRVLSMSSSLHCLASTSKENTKQRTQNRHNQSEKENGRRRVSPSKAITITSI